MKHLAALLKSIFFTVILMLIFSVVFSISRLFEIPRRSTSNADHTGLEIGHARNVDRVRRQILYETGMSKAPQVCQESMARYKAAFNPEVAAAFYNEADSYEYINLLGHTTDANVTGIVAFQFDDKVKSSHIEGAELTFYMRAAQDPSAKLAHLRVRHEMDESIFDGNLTVPNAPTKMYTVYLDRKALQSVIVTHASEEIFFFNISVKGGAHDELLLLPGRRFHQIHMGVTLELKIASSKLLSRRRSRRDTSEKEVMAGQCDENQTSCCPHVQTFSWEDIGFSHIIAPAEFHSVICRGSCEDFQYTDFKHTHNRQMISADIENQCCHPIQHEAQTLIWMDDNDKVSQRDIPNFYATLCSCD